MLVARLIFPIHEAEFISSIVIQDKNDSQNICIYVNYRSLNNYCVHDPFPTPFSDEFLDNVVGSEAYSFTDGFSSYHQVCITKEDKNKTIYMK